MKPAAFLLGSCLLTLVAFRNSVTWHLWKFWGASGYFWQTHWENLHRLLGGNEWIIFTTGNFIIPHLAFWVFNGFFLVADVTGKPTFITRRRIQKDKNDPVEREKLYKAISTVLFNQVFISLPLSFLMLPVMKWRCEPCSLVLPTFHWFLLELTMILLMDEVLIYYAHRLLHHPSLYKYVHKEHHEWTAPISISGYDLHPVEMVGQNLLVMYLPPLIFGSHVTSMMVMSTVILLVNSIIHCGYHLPFLSLTELHDFHHLKFNQCYGFFGILDRLHGTDKLFRQSKAYGRDHILLNFTTLSKSIPDSPKKL